MSPSKINWKKMGWIFIALAIVTVLWIIFKKVIANYIKKGVWTLGAMDKKGMVADLKESLQKNVILRITTWRKINDDAKKKADSEKVIEDIFNKYSHR